MKPWMKALLWLGLGFGLGYFAGAQVGAAKERAESESVEEEDMAEQEDSEQCLNEYRGSTVGELDEILGKPATDDDPEMPMDEPVMPDDFVDIPQLHPQHFIPELVDEETFIANPDDLDPEIIVWYMQDDVMYNTNTQSVITGERDEIFGIGNLQAFGGDPDNPVDTIYIFNKTFGTRFKIIQVDDAFCDAVDGTCAPEDDPPEEDVPGDTSDPDEDDFWDDV